MTRQLRTIYRDWQKTMHRDADGNIIKPPGPLCLIQDRQLDWHDIHPTYNYKSHNFPTYVRTPSAQTHVFLPTRTSLAKQLVRAQRQQHEIYTHITTICFDKIKSPLDTLDLWLLHLSIGFFLYLLHEQKPQKWHHTQVRNKRHYGVYTVVGGKLKRTV
jgi:hypothetical protein